MSIKWTRILIALFLGFSVAGCDLKLDETFDDIGDGLDDLVSDLTDFDFNFDGGNLLIQVVPPPDTKNVSPSSPIAAFTQAGIDDSSFDYGSAVTVSDSSGAEISGSVETLERNGTTVFTFFADDGLTPDSRIDVEVDTPIGNVDWSFETSADEPRSLDGNLSFEAPDEHTSIADGATMMTTDGFTGLGDVNIFGSKKGSADATDGDRYLVLSSGEGIAKGVSLFATTTMVFSTRIDTGGADDFIFDFRFISEEFDEYVGSVYDDTFMVALAGPDGIKVREITSVNKVGKSGSLSGVIFPGLDGEQGTAIRTRTMDISELGSPLQITFYCSDVGDAILPTVVAIDDLRFE